MDKEKVIDLILNDKYYTIDDLRYNRKIGLLFSNKDFENYLKIKDDLVLNGFDYICKLPLKTFNSKNCFYVKSSYLINNLVEYKRILLSDFELNQSYLYDRNIEDIMYSRLFSELEGSLNIESVNTTYSHILKISKSDNLTEQNDIIIKNMINAIMYIVKEKPVFNKENLRTLYNKLTDRCLSSDVNLKEGDYYRDGKVFVGEYEGADYSEIDSCMNSLFEFANDKQNFNKYGELLPYICHYYILYIHPYYDYNGRTARMVSFWLNYINNIIAAPYFMSEAINENKSRYYKAIVETRNTNNDLTCFLGYIIETAIEYCYVYKNMEEMEKMLLLNGDSLNTNDWNYVKKILVHSPEEYFSYKMFLSFINNSISRQAAFKILNNLCNYNILEKSTNKKGDTIFKLNQNMITYKYHK